MTPNLVRLYGVYGLSLVVIYLLFLGEGYFTGYSSDQLRFGADSYTYFRIANLSSLGLSAFISLKQNILGPFLLLKLTSSSVFLVIIINYLMFIWANTLILRSIKVDERRFVRYTFANLLVFGSLILVNKEIFTLVSLALFLSFRQSARKRELFLSIAFAFLARWQLVAVFLLFFLSVGTHRGLKLSRGLTIFGVLVVLTVTIPFINDEIGGVVSGETIRSQSSGILGVLWGFLNQLQGKFLYIVAVWPKILFNTVGNLTRVINVITDPIGYLSTDVYNNLFILSHQFVMGFLIYRVVKLKRFRLSSDLIFLALLFSLLFASSFMVQYRYFYVVFYLLAIEASRQSDGREADEFSVHGNLQRGPLSRQPNRIGPQSDQSRR